VQVLLSAYKKTKKYKLNKGDNNMDAWLNRYMENHGRTTIIVIGAVLAALYIFKG
jgi:hypothetical protein